MKKCQSNLTTIRAKVYDLALVDNRKASPTTSKTREKSV